MQSRFIQKNKLSLITLTIVTLHIGGCSDSIMAGGSQSSKRLLATSTCATLSLVEECKENSECTRSEAHGACSVKTDPNAQTTDEPLDNRNLPANELDSDVIRNECKIIKPLPPAATELELEYSWEASGELARFSQVVATPIVGQLKATDNAPSILSVGFEICDGAVSQPGYLFAVDGASGKQKWVADSTPVRAWLSPAIGDLNNDGTMRIAVVGMDNKLHVLDADGKQQFVSSETVFETGHNLWPTGLSVADLGDNGKSEIIAGNKVFDGATGKLLFKVSGNGFSVVGNTDGTAGLEIVTSAGIFNGNDGTKICQFATPIEDPAIATMQANDKNAVVIGLAGDTMPRGEIRDVIVYSGKDCTVQSRRVNASPGGGSINVADFDGDGVLDFGQAGSNLYMASHIDRPMWNTPAQDFSSAVTGSTTFDFNGDGSNEIIYADEQTLHVFDGKTGREVYTAPHSSYTARETPVVAAVTGNGKARIIVGANTCLPGAQFKGIRVFRDKNQNWVGTHPIWNQHGYNPLLVKPTGGLSGIDAEKITKPWLSASYLAGFRNNIPKVAIKEGCK